MTTKYSNPKLALVSIIEGREDVFQEPLEKGLIKTQRKRSLLMYSFIQSNPPVSLIIALVLGIVVFRYRLFNIIAPQKWKKGGWGVIRKYKKKGVYWQHTKTKSLAFQTAQVARRALDKEKLTYAKVRWLPLGY